MRAEASTIAVGWIGISGLCLIHERTDDLGLRRGNSVHGRFTVHFCDARLEFQEIYFDSQLIARNNGSAEFRFIDRGQEHGLALAVLYPAEDEHARDLRHRFDDQNAGHDGVARKMADKERFIDRDVLDADDSHVLKLENAINEQKRIAMREDFLDRLNIENRH